MIFVKSQKNEPHIHTSSVYIHTSSVYRTYTICPSPRNVGNSFHAVRRGTNTIRFVYTTNANGKYLAIFMSVPTRSQLEVFLTYSSFLLVGKKGGMVFMSDF